MEDVTRRNEYIDYDYDSDVDYTDDDLEDEEEMLELEMETWLGHLENVYESLYEHVQSLGLPFLYHPQSFHWFKEMVESVG